MLGDSTIHVFKAFSLQVAKLGRGRILAVILDWMCGPTFQNPPHSYTWALQIGTHSYTFKTTTYTNTCIVHRIAF